MRHRLLQCAALIAAVSLAGCAGMIHYDNAGVTNTGPEQGPMEYQHPAIGDFLCFGSAGRNADLREYYQPTNGLHLGCGRLRRTAAGEFDSDRDAGRRASMDRRPGHSAIWNGAPRTYMLCLSAGRRAPSIRNPLTAPATAASLQIKPRDNSARPESDAPAWQDLGLTSCVGIADASVRFSIIGRNPDHAIVWQQHLQKSQNFRGSARTCNRTRSS